MHLKTTRCFFSENQRVVLFLLLLGHFYAIRPFFLYAIRKIVFSRRDIKPNHVIINHLKLFIMKRLLLFKKTFKVLGLIALLVCGAWTAQAQTVTITPGATSTNGNDYFYCMPVDDPGTLFKANITGLNGGSTIDSVVSYSWSVLGGIDIVGGTIINPVTIKPKTGNDYATQYSKYAKGRLTVTCKVQHKYQYILKDCDESGFVTYDTLWYEYHAYYSTTIEIRKQFSDLTSNAIVGPECVKYGQSVTYSVAPWVSLYQLNYVGFDDYEWNIPVGVSQGLLYYSADKSSVTFTVGNKFEGKTISVRMGACNLSGQKPLTLTLKAEPGVPTLPDNINFSQGLCVPLDAISYSIPLSNTTPDAVYVWGNLEGWLFNPSATTDTLTSANNYTLTFYPKNDARVLWLKVISPCGTEQIYNLSINRSLTLENKIETVAGGTCVVPNQFVPFTVTGIDNSVAIKWSIFEGSATGWFILPGTENSSHAIIFTGTGNAIIKVSTKDCPGITLTENFGINPKIPVINSGTPICLSASPTTKTFSVKQNDPNATGGYDWDYPSEWIFVGATSNQSSITLMVTQGGEIKVRAIGCDTTNWSDAIEVGFAPVPPQLTGIATCINSGMPDNVTFSVIPEGGFTYDWDIPSDFGYITSANSDKSVIEVYTLGNAGIFEILVRAISSCGLSEWTSDTITISAPFYIETMIFMGKRYISTNIVETNVDWENTYFIWYLNGVQYSEGYGYGGYDYISFTATSIPNGSAYVILITPDGCKYQLAPISWGGKTGRANTNPQNAPNSISDIDDPILSNIIIAPNPARDIVTVTLPEMTNSSIFIFSMDGKLIKRIYGNNFNTEINVSDISNGTYIILAEQNGKRYSKQFIINK